MSDPMITKMNSVGLLQVSLRVIKLGVFVIPSGPPSYIDAGVRSKDLFTGEIPQVSSIRRPLRVVVVTTVTSPTIVPDSPGPGSTCRVRV